MKTHFTFYLLTMAILTAALSSFFYDQYSFAQIMNPDRTGNGTVMKNSDLKVQTMNPGMTLNGSYQNVVMIPGQNITGSVNLMPKLFNFMASQTNISLGDAAAIAQSHVGNDSRSVAGHIGVINGYLTYTICVIDSGINLHGVVVDAGNGRVLSSSIISWQKIGMFNYMMGPMMNSNMMGPMMNSNMMGPMMNSNMTTNITGTR